MVNFRKLILFLSVLHAFLYVLAAVSYAQDQPATYFVAAGAGFSRTATPMATGWMAVGVCIEKSATCPYTEFNNITGVTTTMQGGVIQKLATSGGLSLSALGQIGGATTDGALTGVFSGGIVLSYTKPNWNGFSIVVPIKAVKINGTEVTLSMGWGVNKRF